MIIVIIIAVIIIVIIIEIIINHLFYMDDFKLFAKDDNDLEGLLHTVKTDLEGLLQTVKTFSNDTRISFGLDKCAKATFKRRNLTETTSGEPD